MNNKYWSQRVIKFGTQIFKKRILINFFIFTIYILTSLWIARFSFWPRAHSDMGPSLALCPSVYNQVYPKSANPYWKYRLIITWYAGVRVVFDFTLLRGGLSAGWALYIPKPISHLVSEWFGIHNRKKTNIYRHSL